MNTCEENEKKAKRSRGDRKSSGKSGKSGKGAKSETEREVTPCFVVGTTCDGPDVPAVSSDCGIFSPVVRAWSSRPVGSGAPWGTSSLRLVCCDECAIEESCCC